MANIEMEQEGAPMEQRVGQEAPVDPSVQEVPVDPKAQKDANAYTTGLMKMLHSKETSPKIMEMLKAGPPEVVVPQTALLVNQQMEDGLKAKGSKPSLETLLSASVYLTQDLVEMGNTAGLFQVSEEQVGPIMQATMQQYIEKGLKDKSIDPVELQTLVEPLMDEGQQGLALEAGAASGIPTTPDQNTAMEQYATKREQKGMMRGGQ